MGMLLDSASERLIATANLPNYNSTYSHCFWAYVTASPANGTYDTWMSISDNSNDWDWFGLKGSSGNDFLAIETNVNNSVTETLGSTAISTDTWYFICVVRESATSVKIYLDGALEVTHTTNVGTSRTAPTRLEHGAHLSGNTDSAAFRLSRIKGWDAALTLAEVQQEMYVIRPVRFDNLSRFCPVWWGSVGAGAATDYSGNARDYTVSGTPTDAEDPPIGWGADVLVVSPSSIDYAVTSGPLTMSIGEFCFAPDTYTSDSAYGSQALTAGQRIVYIIDITAITGTVTFNFYASPIDYSVSDLIAQCVFEDVGRMELYLGEAVAPDRPYRDISLVVPGGASVTMVGVLLILDGTDQLAE